MDYAKSITAIEAGVNIIASSEEKIKQIGLQIRKINEEVRELRTYREKLEKERSELKEEIKQCAIQFENISKELAADK